MKIVEKTITNEVGCIAVVTVESFNKSPLSPEVVYIKENKTGRFKNGEYTGGSPINNNYTLRQLKDTKYEAHLNMDKDQWDAAVSYIIGEGPKVVSAKPLMVYPLKLHLGNKELILDQPLPETAKLFGGVVNVLYKGGKAKKGMVPVIVCMKSEDYIGNRELENIARVVMFQESRNTGLKRGTLARSRVPRINTHIEEIIDTWRELAVPRDKEPNILKYVLEENLNFSGYTKQVIYPYNLFINLEDIGNDVVELFREDGTGSKRNNEDTYDPSRYQL